MKDHWLYARGFYEKPKEYSFYSTDTEDKYQKNLKENFEELKLNGWIHHDIEENDRVIGYKYDYNPYNPQINDWVNLSYKINEHGFRGEEMPTEKKPRSIMTLGCSNTFGIGMPVGQIWSTLVGNTLRQRAYNLGVPSGSLDTCFRVLLAWLPKIRPSHVFLLEPPGVRYETHTLSGIIPSLVDSPVPAAFRFEHEDEWVLHREKTMRGIKSLCDQFDTPFYHLSFDTQLAEEIAEMFGRVDAARDLMHPGRNAHTYIAMNMLKLAGYKWDVEINE